LADGRIFTGAQALKVNLVDSLGNIHTAIDKTAQLANIKGEPGIRNYSTGGVWESFFPSFQSLIPGYQQAQLTRWNKIPLALME
ncbi:MAG TPA: S49 family peptidase, partial [Candidatus Caenarcaniphilales bacterium]